MAKQKSPVGNWDRNNCKITVKNDKSGSPVLLEGIYGNALAQGVFHLHRQKAGEYLWRGRISIQSYRDKVRLLRTEDGKAVTMDLRSNHDDIEALKSRIAEAYETLYINNLSAIYRDLDSCRTDDLTLLAVITLHGQVYYTISRGIVEHNIPARIRAMERVAVKLDEYRMDAIPQNALFRAHQELGDAADTAINDLCLFIDYLSDRGLFFGSNPFLRYLHDHPKSRQKSTEALIESADKERSLPDETLDALDELISTAPPEEKRVTGVMLVGHVGFNLPALFNVYWRDVIFTFDERSGIVSCQIRVWIDNSNSYTHNYTRFTDAFTAREMKRRYDSLLAADPELDNKKVLDGVTRTQFVSFCRNTLLRCKTSYEAVHGARTHTSGGGVRLLRSNLRYRLKQYCGIWRISELDYLMMNKIKNDVTVDNYASLSSPAGQKRLQLLLNRDARYALPPASTRMSIRREEDASGKKTGITVPPSNPALTNRVIFKLHLRAGESFTAKAEGGLDMRIIDPEEDPETGSLSE